MNLNPNTYTYISKSSYNLILIIIGYVGLVLTWFFGISDKVFYFSYLTSYFYWLSIILGGMFFIMVHYAFSSTWSVSIRRLMENTIMLIPLFTLPFLPVLYGMEKLFKWLPNHYYWKTHDFEADHLIQHKLAYLNEDSFIFRALLYFVLWNIISIYIYYNSIKHDRTGEIKILENLRYFCMSPMGVFFFISLTGAGLDWHMSLDPHWYSTMFGVYTFAGAFLAFLAFLTFTIIRMQDQGYLKGIVSTEHFHDLGKYLFAFTVFYCYIAGAQFYFIWYSNIPEETIWYLHRWIGSWKIISVLLIVGKFFIPFFILIFRGSKRNIRLLQVMTIWILFMHYIDINFIIMPTVHKTNFHFGLYDLFTMISFALIFVGGFKFITTRSNLVPLNDTELVHSINHRNH
tara:strand:+ start:5131 stop:6333 length:1203 start_codon:yes stop_codon:yes gene_type:complete